jgi:3-deoxy-D-manno-octulosonate 8-phosphate phosphatase (KDO 8-P phosphatase)
MKMHLQSQLEQIKMLALDVDGVLTDGTINMGPDGEVFKPFNCKDGLGLSTAVRHGLLVVIITGRTSASTRNRAKELGITQVYEAIKDKGSLLEEIVTKNKLTLANVAFMGDDLNDLAALQKAGLAATPADAVEDIKKVCPFIAKQTGGHGAVRELIEAIFKSQGRWQEIVAEYAHAGQGDKQ